MPSLSCLRCRTERLRPFYLPPHPLFLRKLRFLLRGSPLALSQAWVSSDLQPSAVECQPRESRDLACFAQSCAWHIVGTQKILTE